jgi:hypothetical protein
VVYITQLAVCNCGSTFATSYQSGMSSRHTSGACISHSLRRNLYFLNLHLSQIRQMWSPPSQFSSVSLISLAMFLLEILKTAVLSYPCHAFAPLSPFPPLVRSKESDGEAAAAYELSCAIVVLGVHCPPSTLYLWCSDIQAFS